MNERRVEHYVRQTLLALRTALPRDERYDWSAERGGDARADMVMRYGWPSYVYWLGDEHDQEHTGWLRGRRSLQNDPYTTYEYTTGRLHTVPSAAAIADPLSAPASAWALTPRQKITSAVWPDLAWWPHEHFVPKAPLVHLPDHQVAFLRRDDHVIIGMSAELAPELLLRVGEAVDSVTLVATHAPDSIYVLARTQGTVGSVVTLQSRITPRPTLVALEFPAIGNRPGGRTRFGATPPRTLADLAPGTAQSRARLFLD